MVAPEATNSPVPMEPPMAIMVRWRARRVRRSVGAGAPEEVGWEGWLDIRIRSGRAPGQKVAKARNYAGIAERRQAAPKRQPHGSRRPAASASSRFYRPVYWAAS
ncbi:hypothetical protein D3C72_1508900 [compost metagenome]